MRASLQRPRAPCHCTGYLGDTGEIAVRRQWFCRRSSVPGRHLSHVRVQILHFSSGEVRRTDAASELLRNLFSVRRKKQYCPQFLETSAFLRFKFITLVRAGGRDQRHGARATSCSASRPSSTFLGAPNGTQPGESGAFGPTPLNLRRARCREQLRH